MMFSHWEEWLPNLFDALVTSMTLTAGALVIGLPLGVLIAITATTSRRSVRYLVIALVELGRGVPALVLLYFMYFGLTQVHIRLSDTAAVVAALGLNCAAYASEIFRGALEAIPHGQWEGARAIGLSRRAIWTYVILPQMQRNAVPPIIGLSILVFQTTSLAMTIGASDLMGVAANIGSITFQYMSVIVLAGLLYASVSIPASQMAGALQRRRDRLPAPPQ
jgi:polar amino acid transport system permease protein